jgi:hypothetical protein
VSGIDFKPPVSLNADNMNVAVDNSGVEDRLDQIRLLVDTLETLGGAAATELTLDAIRDALTAVGGLVVDTGLDVTNLATELTQAALADSIQNRYGGGKQAVTATVTAAGDTTVLTPPAGERLRVFWASAINDPDQETTPLVTIRLGEVEVYRAYAVAHWEIFEGGVDAPLVVNLSEPGSIALTAHYHSFT